MHQLALLPWCRPAVFPLLLVSTARASISRWPATTTALVYMGFIAASCCSCCRCFAAEPLLGPIYVHGRSHFVPPDFPLLLVAPALLHRSG